MIQQPCGFISKGNDIDLSKAKQLSCIFCSIIHNSLKENQITNGLFSMCYRQMQWLTPIIPVLRNLRQEDRCGVNATFICIVSSKRDWSSVETLSNVEEQAEQKKIKRRKRDWGGRWGTGTQGALQSYEIKKHHFGQHDQKWR